MGHGYNITIEDDNQDNFDIKKMVNLFGKPLQTYLRYRDIHTPQPTTWGSVNAAKLVCIFGEDGDNAYLKK